MHKNIIGIRKMIDNSRQVTMLTGFLGFLHCCGLFKFILIGNVILLQ